MTEQAVRKLLLARMRLSTSRREFAHEMRISEGSLSNMLSGRHGLSRKLLDGLGLVAVVDYRVKSDGGAIRKQSPRQVTRKHVPMWKFGDWPVSSKKG